jgi:plasmid stability protein
MGQLLVRKLDDDVKRRLQERAKRHGVSMEQEARSILRAELLRGDKDEYGLGSKIAALFRNVPDNEEPFERKLNEPLRPVNFDE